MAEKKHRSIKRFGPRYGRRVKERFGKIEAVQRKKHTCPYCRTNNVKRVAVGIWHCKKCSSKFTGKAYSPKREVIKEESN